MKIVYMVLCAFLLIVDSLDMIPFINYWDEATILIAPVCAIIANRGKLIFNVEKQKRYLLLFILVAIGILGNLFSPGIQPHMGATLRDVVAFIKFPVIMISLKCISDGYGVKQRHHRDAIWAGVIVSKIFTVAAVAGIVLGKIVDLGFYTGEIRIIDSYQFCFSHPTFLVSSVVVCVVLLVEGGMKKNRKYVILDCILLFMAQRFKGYAFIVFALALLFVKPRLLNKLLSFKGKTKIKRKYIIPVVAIAGFIVFMVFRRRFATYLTWGMTSARLALYMVGVLILRDKFPLGSGFGTFGSFLSGKFYSNIYYMYGISTVDGLGPDKYNYISDAYWPWIYGQLGILGFLGYVILIVNLIKKQFGRLKEYDHIIAFILLWIYALLASTMEAYFTNGTGVVLAIVLSVFIGIDNTTAKGEINNVEKKHNS
ncbi:MAG: hypothetical protein J1E64_00425 [Acetatifactor sp.]|nr:hypothetical protein [Acetatifactor sp.]